MADQDDELVDAVRELARTIDALRTELEGSRPRRRPPLRPPTPRELLRFTDDVALPATLAVLETSVRALEAFQRSLKLLRTEREARDRTTAAAETTSERATELRRTTLSQLDTVLAELQRAASGDGLPANEQARDLLEEARELRDDVDTRLRNAADREREATDQDRTTSERSVTIDIEEGLPMDSGTDDDDADPAVDVDAELETLRDRYADADDDGPHEDEGDESVTDDGGADDGGSDPDES
ncbi:DUF7547 family protein [Natrinema ejinorense]|uniref:Uncharacterized protein n=1 Tax=Natrinema ejinorense TaxID=373386 RepID=A0A2A5QSH4_9EURY|nr:hypothetical protein [Natrinema ejinorense]PCR89798.1 hypothetical protein CP557_04165 [Natrinema ejinorense]